MSMRGKVSAFAMFKGKKATSMSDVDGAAKPTPKEKGSKKLRSANTTPTSSRENSATSIGNIALSTDKKKSDMKKIKKLLKSASKKRPSFLPDHALNSPVFDNGSISGVELKALRPRTSSTSVPYELPLRAKPDVAMVSPWQRTPSGGASESRLAAPLAEGSPTPPLPPKGHSRSNVNRAVAKAQSKSLSNGNLPRGDLPRGDLPRGDLPRGDPARRSQKRRTVSAEQQSPTPDLPPRGDAPRGRKLAPLPLPLELGAASTPAEGAAPARPAKRRKLSQDSASTSPLKPHTTIHGYQPKSPEGVRERKEPLPAHPREKKPLAPYMYDSLEEARRMFECIIHPVVPKKFFAELWEKKPLLVKRHQPDYNSGWFSTAELDRIMKEETIQYGVNLDVVTYTDGKRETHNPIGRAYAPVVWDYYQNGCSVRLLNPQTYSRNVWKLISILQEYFGSCVGANIYLTPPGTQGFAPHYDDIEAFILQLEGKKHWRLYSPRTENETLPRFSSGNFTDEDIGEPILDVILEAGDMLYFPRGTIHQGRTLDDAHSLHITVSCCQKNTWGDLLERVVPRALAVAIEEDVEFRKSLPRDYLNYMGVAFSDKDEPERQTFLRRLEQLMMKLLSYAPVDASCDQMGKQFMHDSLPPVLTEAEKKCSIHGQGEHWDGEQGRVVKAIELEPDTQVKLVRRGAIRLVSEDEKVSVYHSLENARVYHGAEPQYVEITPEMAPGVEQLLHDYPEYTAIDDLPLDTLDERMALAAGLYDKGLLITDGPLEPLSDTCSESEEETQEVSFTDPPPQFRLHRRVKGK